MSFFKKLFKWLFKVLLVILAVLAIAFAVYTVFALGSLTFFGFIQAAVTGFLSLGWYAIPALIGFGYLVDPEGTLEMVEEVGAGVAAIAGVVATAAGDVVSSATGGLLSSVGGWILLVIGGYLVWKMLTKDTGSQESTDITTDGRQSNLLLSQEGR